MPSEGLHAGERQRAETESKARARAHRPRLLSVCSVASCFGPSVARCASSDCLQIASASPSRPSVKRSCKRGGAQGCQRATLSKLHASCRRLWRGWNPFGGSSYLAQADESGRVAPARVGGADLAAEVVELAGGAVNGSADAPTEGEGGGGGVYLRRRCGEIRGRHKRCGVTQGRTDGECSRKGVGRRCGRRWKLVEASRTSWNHPAGMKRQSPGASSATHRCVSPTRGKA